MSKKAFAELIAEFGGNIRTFVTKKGVFTVGTKVNKGKTITEVFDKNFNQLLARESVIKDTGVNCITRKIRTTTDYTQPVFNGGFAQWSDDIKRVVDANGNLSRVVTDHSMGSTFQPLRHLDHVVKKGNITKTMTKSIDGYLPHEMVTTPHYMYYRPTTGLYRV